MGIAELKFSNTITAALLLAAASQAQAGITSITFADTGHTAGQEWPIVPGFWYVRAILADSALNPIGHLSMETTFNTSSVASLPIGVQVQLDAVAPAGSVVIVYRSTSLIDAGDSVETATYTGLCTTGCASGPLNVPNAGPNAGQLRNADFQIGHTAMPVTLQNFLVE